MDTKKSQLKERLESSNQLILDTTINKFHILKIKQYCINSYMLIAESMITENPTTTYRKNGRIMAVVHFYTPATELQLFYESREIWEDPDFVKWYNAILSIIQKVYIEEFGSIDCNRYTEA